MWHASRAVCRGSLQRPEPCCVAGRRHTHLCIWPPCPAGLLVRLRWPYDGDLPLKDVAVIHQAGGEALHGVLGELCVFGTHAWTMRAQQDETTMPSSTHTQASHAYAPIHRPVAHP